MFSLFPTRKLEPRSTPPQVSCSTARPKIIYKPHQTGVYLRTHLLLVTTIITINMKITILKIITIISILHTGA